VAEHSDASFLVLVSCVVLHGVDQRVDKVGCLLSSDILEVILCLGLSQYEIKDVCIGVLKAVYQLDCLGQELRDAVLLRVEVSQEGLYLCGEGLVCCGRCLWLLA
jgi:hypothetical protein